MKSHCVYFVLGIASCLSISLLPPTQSDDDKNTRKEGH